MTYAETLHFLYHSLPVFQHIGGNAYKPGFGNITELEKELGEPHRRFRSVHVAGTNGKGSVSLSARWSASSRISAGIMRNSSATRSKK